MNRLLYSNLFFDKRRALHGIHHFQLFTFCCVGDYTLFNFIIMECARAVCQRNSHHFCFLHLEKLVSIQVCCNCWEDLQRRCDTANQTSHQIQKLLPNPSMEWDSDMDIDNKVPIHMKLIMGYLLEMLGQIEMSLSTQFAEMWQITDAYNAVQRNLKRLK